MDIRPARFGSLGCAMTAIASPAGRRTVLGPAPRPEDLSRQLRTGRVLAMQGGWDVRGSSFNRATQALRQPGSSFKPIVYSAALDNGYTPASVVRRQRTGIGARRIALDEEQPGAVARAGRNLRNKV